MAWKWTASSWRKATEHGKWWRSSEFNAIETAIGKYKEKGATKERLEKLLAILLAIAKWWSWKQEKKFDHVAKPDPALPARKYAASEKTMEGLGSDSDFSARVESVRGLLKDIVDEIDQVMAEDRGAWGGEKFSDPAHPVDDFLYLVSAQTETPLAGPDPEHRLATLKKPELIANAVISASLIKKGNVKLWGPAGFILSAPKTCIGAASPGDVGAANAVGMQHTVEKYIEMLRVLLRVNTGTLPKPQDVLPNTNLHCEIVVLGRSYDSVTTVTGLYLLVDDAQKNVAAGDLKPASCYRQISQFIKPGTTNIQYVVEPLPMVTTDRMTIYRTLHTEKALPIVPILIEKGTAVNGTYFDKVYDGTVMFPRDPARMVLHGSQEHLALEVSAGKKEVNKTMKFEAHKNCAACGV